MVPLECGGVSLRPGVAAGIGAGTDAAGSEAFRCRLRCPALVPIEGAAPVALRPRCRGAGPVPVACVPANGCPRPEGPGSAFDLCPQLVQPLDADRLGCAQLLRKKA